MQVSFFMENPCGAKEVVCSVRLKVKKWVISVSSMAGQTKKKSATDRKTEEDVSHTF